MYLDARVEEALAWEFAGGGLKLSAGEGPSEPDGVRACSIPLAREMARKDRWCILWRLRAPVRREIARCGTDGQSVQGRRRQELPGTSLGTEWGQTGVSAPRALFAARGESKLRIRASL